MKLFKTMKSVSVGLMTAALAVTSLPVGNIGPVFADEAPESDGMILHWDMTKETDDTLKDLTGNGHSGVIHTPAKEDAVGAIEVLDLTGGYVDIPDGTIPEDATEVTINMLVKIASNIKSSWMFCLGSSNKRYLYLTGSSNQDNNMRGCVGCVPTELLETGNGWSYESGVIGSEPLTAGEWQNITVTYKDGGEFTFYKNGVEQGSASIADGNAGNATLQDLMTAGDGLDGYMGWSFYGANDPKFQGKVADFRIYNKELSADEVSTLNSSVEDMLNSLVNADFSAKDIKLTEADLLGANTDANAITEDLSLPTTTKIKDYDATITWESSNTSVISNDGKVKGPKKDTKVTLTGSFTANGDTVTKEFSFKVLKKATPEDITKGDADNLVIPNMTDIRGNITLPEKGELGSTITWSSSNESVISTKQDGEKAPGVVNRQEKADTKVTLTGTFKYEDATVTKEFECVVKKAAKTPELTDYLFAYFPYIYGQVQDERIYFGAGTDGLNFKALNEGKFVIESKQGTHGLRDPFIIRSKEGDKFYMIATDLTVAGLDQDGKHYAGQGWSENQVSGSQYIMVWESTDLVNWSEQRMCHVADDTAGCTWAPEAYYDDATGQYLVFWASKTKADNYSKQRLWCATTRDFYTFSEPSVWIESDQSVIDTTVIKVGDYYYRYTKNEGSQNHNGTPSKRVFCERSKSLLSTEWELVHINSLNGNVNIEGPCIFKINDEDVENAKELAGLKKITFEGDELYCLIADNNGSTIFPGLSDDIETGEFKVLGTGKTAAVGGTSIYSMPEPGASHGTIIPITSEEYNNVMLKWNSSYAEAAADAADKADTAATSLSVPETTDKNLSLPTSRTGATITWESSDPSVVSTTGVVTRGNEDKTVTLTATVVVKGSGEVRDQVIYKEFTVTVPKKEASSVTPGGSSEVKPAPQPTTPAPTVATLAKGKLGSVKNKKAGKAVVKIKKTEGAVGYQVTYADNKKFKKAKSKTTKKTSLTLKKLKKGKTYFVKVRAYKTVNGKKVYGDYSAVKKVKIKK